MSFVILIAGIVIMNLNYEKTTSAVAQNRLLGFGAVIGESVISGFSGVFLERLLKMPDISLWMRNVQMCLVGVPLAIATCLISSFDNITTKGFFHGYDWYVVYLFVLQAASGLLVATVMKYADNISKGFATSIAIIITPIASTYLFDYHLTIQFAIGTVLVIGSTLVYAYMPKSKESRIENVERAGGAKAGIDNEACERDEKDEEDGKIEKAERDGRDEKDLKKESLHILPPK